MITRLKTIFSASNQSGIRCRQIVGLYNYAFAVLTRFDRWNSDRLGMLALQKLNDHTLDDMGLHRSSIEFAVCSKRIRSAQRLGQRISL